MPKFGIIIKSFRSLRESFTYSSSNLFTTLINPKPSKIIPQFSKKHALPSSTHIYILSNHLKNQRVDAARSLFNEIPFPDVYLSTKMISSYIDNSKLDEALKLFNHLPVKDVVMWNLMIKGCVNCGNLDTGLKLFDEMPRRNVISWTTMMNAFLNLGKVEKAQLLFDEMPVRDIAAWNAMIHGYFENGKVEEATRLFEVMPDRNVISWTTMISGLDRNERSDEALSIFRMMVRLVVKPTSNTFSCAITASANVCNLCLGKQVHGHVLKLGYVYDPYITASLVTFYSNCQKIEDCVKTFNEKLHMNVVVWTSLLTGYGYNGEHENALRVFASMIRLGVIPNQSSFTSALNSSCEMGALDWGKGIHSSTVKLGLEADPFVGNSLVVLYTKCGNIKDGILAFKELTDKNIVSWNAIIVGCGQHGFGEWALVFFSQMVKARVDPDEITFTGLLNACGHSDMLQKGQHFFKCLFQFVEVKIEHYVCMVDILCRNGKLDEAENLVIKMPIEPNLSIWVALLGGCRTQSKLEVAERVAKNIFAIDSRCDAGYILLSNIYADAGRWADVERIRKDMKKVGIVKQPGRSLNL